jgi:hypothetical protein
MVDVHIPVLHRCRRPDPVHRPDIPPHDARRLPVVGALDQPARHAGDRQPHRGEQLQPVTLLQGATHVDNAHAPRHGVDLEQVAAGGVHDEEVAIRVVHDAVQANEVVQRTRPLDERGVLDDTEWRAVRAEFPDLVAHGVGHVGVAVPVGCDIIGKRRLACESRSH